MAKKSLNLTGTPGQEYDLDKIKAESRDNKEKPLVVQVHRYNPASSIPENKTPNPSKLKIGQMWLSVHDSDL